MLRCLCFALAIAAGPACAGADLDLEISGVPTVVFDSAHDGCEPDDMPDLNARAYKDASGQTVVFALHDTNRPLTGPDLNHLKIDCHVALASPFDADPAHYADRNFIAATWTKDGRTISALVHHEYHADQFRRCTAQGDLPCWYNTIVAYQSTDSGRHFGRAQPFVVASAPFGQDIEQGRHRGFFNPSNIVSDGRFFYALISTTGWGGQPYGNCLFRTRDPGAPEGWRAFDGTSFTVRYADPYRSHIPYQPACKPIGPFVYPVGSLTFHRARKTWIALFQAKAGGAIPLGGFYYATSPDLLHWGAPRLLLAGPTLYDDLCQAGPAIIGYPALLDPATVSRNYDEVDDAPDLFFAKMAIADCRTGQRLLLRQRVAIRPKGPS